MITIAKSELRIRLSALLKKVVDDGEVILVTDYGHPIAKIVQAKAQRAISTA